MSSKKVRAGISFDPLLSEALDAHAKRLEGFFVDRSEIVNAILADYFEGNGTNQAVRDAVNKRRLKRGR